MIAAAPRVKCAVENFIKVFEAFGRVVHAAAQFHGERNSRRQRVAHFCNDFERRIGLRHQKTAAAAAEHFFHGAGEIQVEDVEAGLDQFERGRGKIVGHGPHELRSAGMFFVGHPQKPLGLLAFGHVEDELIEEHFTNGVGCSQSPGDHSHRPIAITGEGGLHDGEADLDGADA